MKKHIVLIQSLLLLPLIPSASLFGMEPQDGSLTSEKYTTSDNNLGEKYYGAEEGDLAKLTGSLAEPEQPLLSESIIVNYKQVNEIDQEVDRLNAELAALNSQSDFDMYSDQPLSTQDWLRTAETKEQSFKNIHQLLSNPVILHSAQPNKKTTELATTEVWMEKYQALIQECQNPLEHKEAALNEFKTKQPTLKTASILEVTEIAPVVVEDWVRPYIAYNKAADAIAKNALAGIAKNAPTIDQKLTLPTPQFTKWGEKKQAVLKSSTPTAVLSLLSESVMTTPTLAKTGLADLPYAYQAGYGSGLTHSAWDVIEYLFTDVATPNITKKKKYKFPVDGIDTTVETSNTTLAHYLFDIDNETHLKLLEETFDYYVDQKNTAKIVTLLDKIDCAAGKLHISPRVAKKLHTYIDAVIQKEEENSKLTLQEKSSKFVATNNALVVALQEEYAKRIKDIEDEFAKYNKDHNDTIAKNADHIRNLRHLTLTTHVIAPSLQRKEDKCSDIIDQLHPGKKNKTVYMTPDDIHNAYSNTQLLKKMQLSEPMAQLQSNTQWLLENTSAINRATQNIKLLQ